MSTNSYVTVANSFAPVYRSDELPHSVNRSGTIDLLAIRSSGGMSLLQFKFI